MTLLVMKLFQSQVYTIVNTVSSEVSITPDYFSEMSSLHRTVQATENVTLILVIFKLSLTNERLLGPQRVGKMYDPVLKQ